MQIFRTQSTCKSLTIAKCLQTLYSIIIYLKTKPIIKNDYLKQRLHGEALIHITHVYVGGKNIM